MQPCQICGGMAIDPNGYCTQCGTFRGQVAPPVSGAPQYPPQPQPVYQYPQQQPASGAPYAGQPSGAPYGGQVSGAPYPLSGPPISGGGYQPPPSAPPARRSFTGPLIASSAVLVVLIAAIIVVAIVRNSGGNQAGGGGSPTPGPSPTPSPAIDACLVGTWQATSDRETIDIPDIGPITVVGSGLLTHVHPDGSVTDDYSQAKPYTAQYNGHTLSIEITGTVTSTITTASNTISFHNIQANGTETWKVDNQAVGSPIALDVDSDPVQYTCATNTATEHTSHYDLTLTRKSPMP
jgi:hypothetical protein